MRTRRLCFLPLDDQVHRSGLPISDPAICIGHTERARGLHTAFVDGGATGCVPRGRHKGWLVCAPFNVLSSGKKRPWWIILSSPVGTELAARERAASADQLRVERWLAGAHTVLPFLPRTLLDLRHSQAGLDRNREVLGHIRPQQLQSERHPECARAGCVRRLLPKRVLLKPSEPGDYCLGRTGFRKSGGPPAILGFRISIRTRAPGAQHPRA